MEIEEVDAVLEKIWDLHDKLSDAIHSISRNHFLSSVKSIKNGGYSKSAGQVEVNRTGLGFVFVKDSGEKDSVAAAVAEAKSLNAIRSALENLEDQLEFFHIQQRAERDAALARLEQSRIILAVRLAEHNGRKYKVIEEALDFVGDVKGVASFVSPEDLTQPAASQDPSRNPGLVFRALISSFGSAKKFLQLDKVGGMLGNAALFAISMLAWLHLHQIGRDRDQTGKKPARLDGSSSSGQPSDLDVLMARG